jgi:hypothetical protein
LKTDYKTDLANRQVFHQFDVHKPTSNAPSVGVSPTKTSAYQVAMAQEYAKGTPKRQCKEMALKAIKPCYDVFALQIKDTPNGTCPCVNRQKRKWIAEKFDKIEQQRKIENEKSRLRHLENDRDVEICHN